MSGINRIQTVANTNVNGFDGFANVAVMARHESSPSLRHLPGKERALPVSKCLVRRQTRCIEISGQQTTLCYRDALCYRDTQATSAAVAAGASTAGRWPGRLPASAWGAFVIQNALRG